MTVRKPPPNSRRLISCRQNHAESRLDAHHAIVGLRGPLQRKDLRHGPHSVDGGEAEGVLRVDGRSGRPTLDGSAPPNEKGGGHLKRFVGGAEQEELPVEAETSQDRV